MRFCGEKKLEVTSSLHYRFLEECQRLLWMFGIISHPKEKRFFKAFLFHRNEKKCSHDKELRNHLRTSPFFTDIL